MSLEFWNSFDIMPSISTHVLFYLMQEFAYSFNHAAANRLTEWHGNFNKRWIRGNKGKHILLHIINKEKIAKKNKNSAWIFIKIQLKKKKHQQQQQQKNSVCTSTGKHFLSKHRTIKMLALIIKIETFHWFVIVLKAEQKLKRFSPFYAPNLF